VIGWESIGLIGFKPQVSRCYCQVGYPSRVEYCNGKTVGNATCDNPRTWVS